MMASCSELVIIALGKVMQADLLTRLGIADRDRDAAHLGSPRRWTRRSRSRRICERRTKFVQVLGRGWRRGHEGLA